MIVGDRIYLTTAITEPARSALRTRLDQGLGLLALVSGVWTLSWLWSPGRKEARAAGGYRLLAHLDRLLCAAAAFVVTTFAVLLAIGPDALDNGLHVARDVVVVAARSLGRERTNLWFVDWDEANRHITWILTTGAALSFVGLIPFRMSSTGRTLGALAGAAGVALAIHFIPWSAAYGDRMPDGPVVVGYALPIVLAMWHGAISALVARRRIPVGRAAAGPWGWTALQAALAAAVVVGPNYLDEREMVMRRIICLETRSGTVLWRSDVFATLPSAKASLNSDATPTPVVVGDTIVAAFGPGIAAVDTAGRVLWTRMFPFWIENAIYGAASSPVADDRTVYVTVDREYEGEQESRVMAYDARSGEELWAVTPRLAHDGYATPAIYDDGDRQWLVTVTSRAVVAYDRRTGSERWRVPVPIHQPVPSPLVTDGLLVVTGGIGEKGQTAAYQLRGDASPRTLWTSPLRADVASPLVHRGRLFLLSSTGTLMAYDVASGRQLWTESIGSGSGSFYASPVAVNDTIVAIRSNGAAYVVASADRFRLLSTTKISDDVFASPAIGAGCLLVRSATSVLCMGSAGDLRARSENP